MPRPSPRSRLNGPGDFETLYFQKHLNGRRMDTMNGRLDFYTPAATRLIRLLRARGPQTAKEMASELGISGVAVRAGLRDLESRGLVARTTERRPLGRP